MCEPMLSGGERRTHGEHLVRKPTKVDVTDTSMADTVGKRANPRCEGTYAHLFSAASCASHHALHSSKPFPKPSCMYHKHVPVSAPHAHPKGANPTHMPSPLTLPMHATPNNRYSRRHCSRGHPSHTRKPWPRTYLAELRARSSRGEGPGNSSGRSAKEMCLGVEAPEAVPLQGPTPSIESNGAGVWGRGGEKVWNAY